MILNLRNVDSSVWLLNFLAKFFTEPGCHEERLKIEGLPRFSNLITDDQHCFHELVFHKNHETQAAHKLRLLHPRRFDDISAVHQPFVLHLAGVSERQRN